MKGSKLAHFAVFPEKLPETFIKVGTSEKGCCPQCGSPWARVIESNYNIRAVRSPDEKQFESHGGSRPNMPWMGDRMDKTLSWLPTCSCNAGEPVPCVVLDCFAGSGTTLLVASKLGRKSICYELSEEYCSIAVQRNKQGVMV